MLMYKCLYSTEIIISDCDIRIIMDKTQWLHEIAHRYIMYF